MISINTQITDSGWCSFGQSAFVFTSAVVAWHCVALIPPLRPAVRSQLSLSDSYHRVGVHHCCVRTHAGRWRSIPWTLHRIDVLLFDNKTTPNGNSPQLTCLVTAVDTWLGVALLQVGLLLDSLAVDFLDWSSVHLLLGLSFESDFDF